MIDDLTRKEMKFCAQISKKLFMVTDDGISLDVIDEINTYKSQFIFDHKAHKKIINILLTKNNKLYIIPTTMPPPLDLKIVKIILFMGSFFNIIECSLIVINFIKAYLAELHYKIIESINNCNIRNIVFSGVSMGGIQSQLIGLLYIMLIDFYKNYYKKDISIPEELTALTQSFYKWLYEQNKKSKSIEELMENDYKVFSRVDIKNVFAFGIEALTNDYNKIYDKYMTCEDNLNNSKSFVIHNPKDAMSFANVRFSAYIVPLDILIFFVHRKWIDRDILGCIIVIDDNIETNPFDKHLNYDIYIDNKLRVSEYIAEINNPIKNFYNLGYYSLRYYRYIRGFGCFTLGMFADLWYAILIPFILLFNKFYTKYYIHRYQLMISFIFYLSTIFSFPIHIHALKILAFLNGIFICLAI